MEEGGGKRLKTTQEQKPRNPGRVSLWVGGGAGGAGAEAVQDWPLLSFPVTLS